MPYLTNATPPEANAPTLPAERLLNLVAGALAGAAIVGLLSLAGRSSARRRRAAAEASQIRGEIEGLADVARAAAAEATPPPVPARPTYPDERLGNFIRGLLLGALIGGVAMLFRTPRSGTAARAHLQARVGAARAHLNDLTAEARTAVTDFAAWANDDTPLSAPTTMESLTLERGA